MDKPLFVETSKGFINLALVTYVGPSANKDEVGFCFAGSNEVAFIIPIDEWNAVWKKMANEGLFVVDGIC